MTHRVPTSRCLLRRALQLTPLAAALAWSQFAAAQATVAPAGVTTGSSPFYIGASQTFSRDSNIFRLASDPARRPTDALGQPRAIVSDTVSTTALLAGLDQPFGRQRFKADLQARYSKFQDQEQLDNSGYQIGLGLDWEALERLSGTLSLVAAQNLARFGTESTLQTTERNIERARQFNITAQYGGASVLAVYGLFDHRAIDYSLASFDTLDYERNQIGVGVRYRVGGALTVGAEARTGKGEYPRARGGLGDEFDRDELALTALWVPTGASRLRARIAATKQSHDADGRDFSGATGVLAWDYRPTGKLRFETELRRDTGQESDPLLIGASGTFRGIEAVGENSDVSNRLQVRGLYEATAKIELDALLRYIRRSLVDTLTLPGIVIPNAGSDRTTQLSLGARYSPTRAIQLGCSVGRIERTADSTVSFGYSANTASCFAQLLLNP